MDTPRSRAFAIGEVIQQLQSEFPEISPSMIRFWEREGLIAPDRSQGGHRQFSERDLERLRLIAELRQRRYWPLGAVKHFLRHLDQDSPPDFGLYEEVFRPEEYDPEFRPLTLPELAAQANLAPEAIQALEHSGLLPPGEPSETDRRYDKGDLTLAKLLSELRELGVDPEELTFYVCDIRDHVRHELDLLYRLLGSCQGEGERRTRFEQLQQSLRQLRSRLYRRYWRHALAKLLEDD